MYSRPTALISSIIISLCCCTWQGFVETVFEILTVSEPASAEEVMAVMYHEDKPLPTQIKNFEGTRVEIPGFTSYYLRYNASEGFVLGMVNSLPYYESIEFGPDGANRRCELSSEAREGDTFFPIYTDALEEISFWHPEQIKAKKYYYCFKYPWSHTFLFDQESSTVYHVIEEIHD